jgi:hypothetical protein
MPCVFPCLLVWATLGIALIACRKDTVTLAPTQETLRSGNWGGAQARLRVDAQAAELQLSCAHGAIAAPLAIQRDGQFEWKGTFTQERPGPTRQDEDRTSPAVYAGTLTGDTLTLSVRVGENVVLDRIELTYGRAVRIVKCA